MPPSPRPTKVCRYDGKCFRKNPQHFADFLHPTQLPHDDRRPAPPRSPEASPSASDAHTDVPARSVTPPPRSLLAVSDEDEALHGGSGGAAKRQRSGGEESDGGPCDGEASGRPRVCQRSTEASRARELQEGPASPALLGYLLSHDPVRDCVETVDADAAAGAKPALVALPDLAAVDAYLRDVYAMEFTRGDCEVVLRAAVQLRPADPLRAFAGWRLTGPLEVAWRSHCGAGVQWRSEAARWRWGRYRHDPPECMTVAIACDESTGDDAADGRHLCHFRDEPTAAPSLLVDGTARDSAFALRGHSLSAYLCASAAHTADGNLIADAFAAAARVLAEAGPAGADAARALGVGYDGTPAASLAAQQSAAQRQRRSVQLAPTFHGLGILAPYDRRTEVGYRPLTMTRQRLRQALSSWDGEYRARQPAPAAAPVTPQPATTDACRVLTATLHEQAADRPEGVQQTTKPQVLKDGARAFTAVDRAELQDQFRYADMANDEGDFALNLELGLDIFSLVEAPSPPRVACFVDGEGSRCDGGDEEHFNPLLWHAFRILDCAYMLLDRPLYRHILRCHLPVLAGQQSPHVQRNSTLIAFAKDGVAV